MNIALAQQAVPPNHESALQRGIQAVRTAAARGADLVVFPELSFTPFYPQVPADERAGKTTRSAPRAAAVRTA